MSSKKLSLKKRKDGILYHSESNLVFNDDKLVIGRLENDNVIPFDETCLELCEKYNFKYDTSLVETNEDEVNETVETAETVETLEQEDNEENEENGVEEQDVKQEVKQDVKPEVKQKSKQDVKQNNEHERTEKTDLNSMFETMKKTVTNLLAEKDEQIELLKKELESTKKKLKSTLAVVSAMQSEL